jgi:hypothetical protein
MTVVKTEGQHKGEFLVSEGNGTISRAAGVLSSGQVVTDGRVLKWSGTELIVAAGTIDSDGASDEDLAGIAYGSYDASADGPGGAVDTPIVYIARLAEVKAANVTYHVSETNAAAKTAAMKVKLAESLNIVSR